MGLTGYGGCKPTYHSSRDSCQRGTTDNLCALRAGDTRWAANCEHHMSCETKVALNVSYVLVLTRLQWRADRRERGWMRA